MDREELQNLINEGPVTITMNDGRAFKVVHPREALVTQISAHVLYRADDGRLKAMVLPLVAMAHVEPFAEAT